MPVIISALLLSAHFLRAGRLLLVAISLAFPLLLLVRRRWAARAVQLVLVLGAAEWVRTALAIVHERQDAGLPWVRSVVILGVVAIFTAATALVLQLQPFKLRYSTGRRDSVLK